MSDPRDPVGARYRELAREEPPAHADAAILAASRRAVGARPGGHRWFVPLSVAAVLVLGIGVALRMQVEQPGVETSMPQSEYSMPAPPPEEPAAARESASPAMPQSSERAAPVVKVEKQATPRAVAPAAPRREAPAPARTAAPAPVPGAAPVPAPGEAPAAASGEAPAALRGEAPPPAAAAAAVRVPVSPAPPPPAAVRAAPQERRAVADEGATPEAELERITRLRRAGRHDEADKALEEFRRRFPAHRIPDAVWEQVKPR